MRKLHIAWIAGSLCASTASAEPPLTRHTLSAAERAAVLAGVKEGLVEPFGATVDGLSAGWRMSKAGNRVVTVCGYVRALSRAGSFTGRVPFIGLIGTATRAGGPAFVVLNYGTSDTQRQVVVKVCREDGLLAD